MQTTLLLKAKFQNCHYAVFVLKSKESLKSHQACNYLNFQIMNISFITVVFSINLPPNKHHLSHLNFRNLNYRASSRLISIFELIFRHTRLSLIGMSAIKSSWLVKYEALSATPILSQLFLVFCCRSENRRKMFSHRKACHIECFDI
jgi:hypothetical protein